LGSKAPVLDAIAVVDISDCLVLKQQESHPGNKHQVALNQGEI